MLKKPNYFFRFAFFQLFISISFNLIANNEHFILTFSITDVAKVEDDTAKPYFIDKSNSIILGINCNYRDYKLNFNNIKNNLQGQLRYDYYKDDFGKEITSWEFHPSLDQYYLSLNALTKYGGFTYSRSLISSKNNENTSLNSISVNIPFKFMNFSMDYIKMKGYTRIEPINNSSSFFPDLVFSPLSVGVDLALGKLKNTYLYIPRKSSMNSALYLGYSKLVIENPSDFIPAIKYQDGFNDANHLQMVEGLFVDKFTSKGFNYAWNHTILWLLWKSKNSETPKAFYLKGNFIIRWNFQKYDYHTLSDTMHFVQMEGSLQQGSGETRNYYGGANLVYDNGKSIFGLGGSVYSFAYGAWNEGDANHTVDNRYYLNVFYNYRLPFNKGIKKVEKWKSKFNHKKSPEELQDF